MNTFMPPADDAGVSFPCVFDTARDTLHFDLADGMLTMVIQPHDGGATCVVRLDCVEALALSDVLTAALDDDDFSEGLDELLDAESGL